MNSSAPIPHPQRIAATKSRLSFARRTLVALVAATVLTGCLDHDPDFSAVYETQRAIKQKLVSPGSTEFNRKACRVAATTKDGRFRIAYVEFDSQNRFGAKLRSYGLALVMDKPDDAAVLASEVYEESPKKADLLKLTQAMGEAWQVADWAK